jgi:hypothetical protein
MWISYTVSKNLVVNWEMTVEMWVTKKDKKFSPAALTGVMLI